MQKKWQMKLVLLLTLLGAVGIVAIIPYEYTMLMDTEFYQSHPDAMPLPFVITINSVIKIGFLFILVLIGVRLQRRTGLGVPKIESLVYEKQLPNFSRKGVWLSVSITFVLSVLLILSDLFLFSPFISSAIGEQVKPIWWQGILAMIYGGITEELMLRLFGMTFIVWVLAVIMRREKEAIPPSFYYIAIFLTAILFGIGHLPATMELFGELSAIIVTRAIVLNGLVGVWFGYLYWRKGLEYAIIAHMSADFFIHVLFMQLLS